MQEHLIQMQHEYSSLKRPQQTGVSFSAPAGTNKYLLPQPGPLHKVFSCCIIAARASTCRHLMLWSDLLNNNVATRVARCRSYLPYRRTARKNLRETANHATGFSEFETNCYPVPPGTDIGEPDQDRAHSPRRLPPVRLALINRYRCAVHRTWFFDTDHSIVEPSRRIPGRIDAAYTGTHSVMGQSDQMPMMHRRPVPRTVATKLAWVLLCHPIYSGSSR